MKPQKHKWEFKPRFRRHAFGWKSGPAIKRIKEAVSEIKKIKRTDIVLAAEGAVTFIEKLSPAIEHVDSSSGSIGSAVNNAIVALVPIIAAAPASEDTRENWLERLFEAHAEDQMPYIEILTDFWGELCASEKLASEWADRLHDITKMAFSEDKSLSGHFHGATACLSSLYAAGRYDEVVELVRNAGLWTYKQWAVKSLASKGNRAEAIRYAESCRDPWASDIDIDRHCEKILLESGMVEEAYDRYGLTANRATTYLSWFRAVKKKYNHKTPGEILQDLITMTPGEEGKWFAAAKSEKLFDEAIALANRSPCAPQTLARAARDYEEDNPTFAVEAGLAALKWLAEGYGYEVSNFDVLDAYDFTLKAAKNANREAEVKDLVRKLICDNSSADHFVVKVLSPKLGALG